VDAATQRERQQIEWNERQRKSGIIFLAEKAQDLKAYSPAERGAKALEYIAQSDFADNQDIIAAVQAAMADGLMTDDELDGFSDKMYTASERLAREQWQTQFDENKRQFGLNYGLNARQVAAAEAKAKAEASEAGSGLNPALAGLPSGVQSAIVTKELTGLDASEEAVGKARSAANIARAFMADSEGYGSLGGGPLADIGQVASQKTAQLKGHTARMIPMMRSPGEGEMTDSDAKRYELSVVSINKGRTANEAVVRDLERFEANEVARDKFLREWQAQNGYGSVSQAKLLWQQYADAEPIFDPETGQPRERQTIYGYLAGSGASGAGDTEFDDVSNIPEGATVEDENGKRFRKQNGQLVPVTRF
jgi:hypothetical protein